MTAEQILSIACMHEGLILKQHTDKSADYMFQVKFEIEGTPLSAYVENRSFRAAKDRAVILILQQLLNNDDAKKKQSNV